MRTTLLCLAGALFLTACPSSSKPTTNQPTRIAKTPPPVEVEPELDGDVADLVMQLYAAEFAVREAAANQLGAMGADAAPALPELLVCAGTEPFEGGSREPGDLDPGYLAESEPVEACAAAIAAISEADPPALVAAMAMPLDTKRTALAALGDHGGGEAIPGLVAVYLDACERSMTATNDGAAKHLRVTADAAIAALAAHPNTAASSLGDDSDCALAGAERISQLAAAN